MYKISGKIKKKKKGVKIESWFKRLFSVLYAAANIWILKKIDNFEIEMLENIFQNSVDNETHGIDTIRNQRPSTQRLSPTIDHIPPNEG